MQISLRLEMSLRLTHLISLWQKILYNHRERYLPKCVYQPAIKAMKHKQTPITNLRILLLMHILISTDLIVVTLL